MMRKQKISRYEALQTLTSNVAYMWHEEERMGPSAWASWPISLSWTVTLCTTILPR